MRKTVLLALLLATAALASCSGDGEGEDDRRRIAVIPKGNTHEFWKSIHAGAEKAGEDLGVEIIWKGPQREGDRESQIKVIEDFISRGVDGIVCAPLDARALVLPFQDAVKEGIPVVIADSGVDWDGYISFVATDNYLGGAMGARHLAALLGGEGKVIMMRHQEGHASTMKRADGFLETLTTEFPEIEILSSNQYGGDTTESAYQTAENLLISHGEVTGLFCPTESTTFGMLRALQDAGMAGNVMFVGFDASDKLVDAVRESQIHGLVVQNPFMMGEVGVKTLIAHLEGEGVEKRIDTGAWIVTPENVDDPEMVDLHSRDLSRWLR